MFISFGAVELLDTGECILDRRPSFHQGQIRCGSGGRECTFGDSHDLLLSLPSGTAFETTNKAVKPIPAQLFRELVVYLDG